MSREYRRKHCSEFKKWVLQSGRPFIEFFRENIEKKKKTRFNQNDRNDVFDRGLRKFWMNQTFNPNWFLKYRLSKGSGEQIRQERSEDMKTLRKLFDITKYKD